MIRTGMGMDSSRSLSLARYSPLQHVGGEEDGAALVAHLAHHALQQMRRLGVKAHKGFVHDDELRLMQPRGDDGQLLLHAVGIGGDRLGQILRQLEGVGVFSDALLPLPRSDAEDIGHEVQVLDARHKVVQVGVVGDVGHLPLAAQGIRLDGLTVNGDLPLIELQNAHHGFQRGGLACAVVADEAVNFAGPDVQAQVVDRLFLSVKLCKMLNFQHRIHSFIIFSILYPTT